MTIQTLLFIFSNERSKPHCIGRKKILYKLNTFEIGKRCFARGGKSGLLKSHARTGGHLDNLPITHWFNRDHFQLQLHINDEIVLVQTNKFHKSEIKVQRDYEACESILRIFSFLQALHELFSTTHDEIMSLPPFFPLCSHIQCTLSPKGKKLGGHSPPTSIELISYETFGIQAKKLNNGLDYIEDRR